jgi:hypothetical protein
MHENIERIIQARRRHSYAKFRLPTEKPNVKGECWISHVRRTYFADVVWVDSPGFHISSQFMLSQSTMLVGRTIKELCAELKRKGIDLEQATGI